MLYDFPTYMCFSCGEKKNDFNVGKTLIYDLFLIT